MGGLSAALLILAASSGEGRTGARADWQVVRTAPYEGVSVHVQAPPDWKVEGYPTGEVYLSSPPTIGTDGKEARARVDIASQSYLYPGEARPADLDAYLSRYDEYMEGDRKADAYEEHERDRVPFAGQHAWRIVYSKNWFQQRNRFVMHLWLAGGEPWVATYFSTAPELFDRYQKVAGEILETIGGGARQPVVGEDGRSWQTHEGERTAMSEKQGYWADASFIIDFPPDWKAREMVVRKASAEQERGLHVTRFRPESKEFEVTFVMEGLALHPHELAEFHAVAESRVMELLDGAELLERGPVDVPQLDYIAADASNRLRGSGQVFRAIYEGKDAQGESARGMVYSVGSRTIAFHLILVAPAEQFDAARATAEAMLGSLDVKLVNAPPF